MPKNDVIPTVVHFGWLKPRYVANGPAIIAASDSPKKQNHPTIAIEAAVQAYIQDLNFHNPDVWALFEAPDVGPTKGRKDKDKIIYIMAGWSGNPVKILEQVGDWVKVESISLARPLPSAADVNHELTPWLVHRMTMVNKKNEFFNIGTDGKTSPRDILDDPLFSMDGEFWLPLEWILETAAATAPLEVRNGPDFNLPPLEILPLGAALTVYSMFSDASQNKWASLGPDRWCCLKSNDISHTNWILK